MSSSGSSSGSSGSITDRMNQSFALFFITLSSWLLLLLLLFMETTTTTQCHAWMIPTMISTTRPLHRSHREDNHNMRISRSLSSSLSSSDVKQDDANDHDILASSSSSSSSSSCHSQRRRDFMFRSLVLSSGVVVGGGMFGIEEAHATDQNIIISNNSSNNNNVDEETVPVLKTSSGLKYIDIVPGTGASPSYGNLCSLSYTAYVKLPTTNSKQYSTKPQKYDHSDAYLVKHGNGRMIAGLDEGLHTMKVGGTRRLLIPPKLGFVDVGLGPLPDQPWNRNKLNQLLDQMIELSGGTMIYEVTLLSVIPDEADLGYYSDASLSPDDFNTLRENLTQQGNEARIRERAQEMADNTIKGQDRLL